VRRGRAHGILVYADVAVVGWCQYGPVAELPIGGRGRPGPTDADWRTTCLVTDEGHRHLGVSRRALRAALVSIRRRGGMGTVAMLEAEGFEPVSAYDDRRLVMRRRL
jgi:GNAT superfamily N-acetyltransferase